MLRLPSNQHNLVSRPKAAGLNTDHNSLLHDHVSSHEFRERNTAWLACHNACYHTLITCSQLPSLATHITVVSIAWKPKETNRGSGAGTGIAHQALTQTKPRSSHTVKLIYQPWVLHQWCQQSAYVTLGGVTKGALGSKAVWDIQTCWWDSV